MKKDLVGTIKSLRHIEPDEGHVFRSKKRLIAAIDSHRAYNLFPSFRMALAASSILSVLFLYSLPTPQKAPRVASLNENVLAQELDAINFENKIEEAKKTNETNKAIDRAVQNLALTSNPTQRQSPPTTTELPAIDEVEPNNDLDTILDELL